MRGRGRPKGAKNAAKPVPAVQCQGLRSGAVRQPNDKPNNETHVQQQTKCRQLRANTKNWLVGTSLEALTGNKLPLNRLVLRRYLYLREQLPLTNSRTLCENIVTDLFTNFWQPARIPTKSKKLCIDQVVELINRYRALYKATEPYVSTEFLLSSLTNLSVA